MNNKTLTIPEPIKEEIVEKQKECFNAILKVIDNELYSEIEKLTLISYYSQLALDETVNFKEFDLKKPDNTFVK